MSDDDSDPMRALVAQAGAALFGPRWPTPLAAALNLNERTVRRWNDPGSRSRPPESVMPQLIELLLERKAIIDGALGELSGWGGSGGRS